MGIEELPGLSEWEILSTQVEEGRSSEPKGEIVYISPKIERRYKELIRNYKKIGK